MTNKHINSLCAPVVRAITGIILALSLSSCGGIAPHRNYTPDPNEAALTRNFSLKTPDKAPVFAKKEELEEDREEEGPFEYRLGPGDVIALNVWRRPELSQDKLIVSPDGFISAPRIGMVNVSGKSLKETTAIITEKLEALYIKPEVTVKVHEFNNNKAYVLGNVNKPGMVRFNGRGTLLEGLSLAGGVTKNERMSEKMTKCSIIRGNDQVIWIDLQDLLTNGNMSLNTTIRNNDVIYVPQRSHDMVYVMGEVKSPGALQLHDGMSVFKAVMMAGGMMRTANAEKVFIIRQQDAAHGAVVSVNLEQLIECADFRRNYLLMPDDIIYVSPSGMARFNYSLEDIMPTFQIINLGTSAINSVNSTVVIPSQP